MIVAISARVQDEMLKIDLCMQIFRHFVPQNDTLCKLVYCFFIYNMVYTVRSLQSFWNIYLQKHVLEHSLIIKCLQYT